LDWRAQADTALSAFGRNGFFVFVVRLVPLAGG